MLLAVAVAVASVVAVVAVVAVAERLIMTDSKNQGDEPSELKPAIRRAQIAQLTIYEISETELEVLARGSSNPIYLNFAIFLLSVFASFVIALLTTTINSDRVFTVFVVIAVVGAVLGGLLLILWFKTRKSISELVQTIKDRLLSEGIREEGTTTDD